MSEELSRIFQDLRVNYAPNVEWVDVEEYLYGEEASDEVWHERAVKFWSLPMCRTNISRQENELSQLRELSVIIRRIREANQPTYNSTHDNWANLINVSPADAYLAYIYTLVSLANPPEHILKAAPSGLNRNLNLQLAVNAVSTYFLTLTIPGAKSFGIFDQDIIEQVLKVFKLLELNGYRNERTIWMYFLTVCDDLKLVFRYVHFKEHLQPRDKIIRCLMEILYNNFKMGYPNPCAATLHTKCYELFEEIATEHNGDVYETLQLILRQSFPMHIYADSPQTVGGSRRGGAMKSGEHISDCFINLIGKYPDILTRILHFYIECVVTNPIKAWKSTDEKVAIGYAAKYDGALFAKCNKSCTDFIIEAIKADDAVGIQTRALDLAERILQHQTEVQWSIFRYEVSKVPREVGLIREVMRSLNDRTFTVRRKACQMLIMALKQGSPMTNKILDESIRFVQFEDDDVETLNEPGAHRNELRFEKPGIVQYAFSFEGHEALETEVKNLPQIIYQRFLNSDNGLARAAGIALLERLILINPLIIYNTNFVRETSLLAVDRLASVRKSALEMIETLLQTYSNCFALICVYCRIWACLLSDEDVALQKQSLQSFNQVVLKNIQPMEYSNEPRHFMPWRIVGTLLMTQPRSYLQERFAMLLDKEPIVTPKLVDVIISHLSTSTATEAWALLLFLSSRITNKLDALISIFNGLSSYSMKTNQLLALQLIICCLANFSKPALNQLFERLLTALRSGSIWLGLISSAINLLNQIHYLSLSQAPSMGSDGANWQIELLEDLRDEILSCAGNFQEEYTRLQCLLGAYTEIIVMLPQDVDERIVGIVFKYLQECTKLNESQFDTDNERMTNWMIVIAGRLCLRDNHLANSLARIFKVILTKNDRPQIINTTLIALNDLGQKHPSILENNFQCILGKLNSNFAMTRVRTFRCVKDVILSGNIKLKGPILTSLLASLVDESPEVAREADAFFIRYKRLYDKLLFEHCLKECPFDLNDQSMLRGVQSNTKYQSPLKGEDMTRNRRLLYNHIISTMEDHKLLMYFGQLKLLAEKTKDKAFVTSPGSLAVVQDMLFIMRRICFHTKGKKASSARGDGENSDEGEEESAPPPPPTPSPSAAASTSENAAPKGRGRGARQRDALEEPLKQLERCLRYVEETYRNLQSVMNPQLQHAFDNLCRAMAMRFPTYIEFAQPLEFWQKFRGGSKTPKRKQRKAQQRNEDDEDMDPDVENEATEQSQMAEGFSDSDNELPLERHKAAPSKTRLGQRKSSCDMLVTELIFQPPDW
ncbi:uncharacterized protein Cap-D3 [Drosophila tropicalis]|uniref:uncharacterized protein Cap-D3 n=1 Tax=Drosophila tropicalis TaxID=46794 RepID=UPI0035ABDF25